MLSLAAVAVTGVSSADAQTWAGTSGNLWSAPANWSGGAVPVNNGTANVVFSLSNSSASVNLDTSWNVASVTFDTTPGMRAPTVYGTIPTLGYNSPSTSALTVQSGGITNASGTQVALIPSLVAAQPQVWDTGSGGVVVYRDVTGTSTITKVGSGALTLINPQNSLTGGFEATAGTIIAVAGSSLGADGSRISLSNAAAIGFGFGPVMQIAVAFNHPVTLGTGGGAFSTRSGSTIFTGSISGPGALSFLPDKTLSYATMSSYALSGDNTYAGGTTVGAGVTLNISGTGQTLGTGNVLLQSGGALALGSSNNLAPGSTVTLQGNTASQYSSAVVINDPAINPTALVNVASAGGVVALGNITYTTPLDFSTIGNGQLAFGAGGNGFYRATALGPGQDGVYRFGGGTAGLLTLDGADNVLTGSRSVVIGETGVSQSSLLGTGSYGATAIEFARSNNYTGGTTLNLGTLYVADDHALGSGALTFNGGVLQADGGARSLTNAVTLNAGGFGVSIRGANALTFAGPVDLNGGTRIVYGSGLYGGVVTFANVIANGNLTLSSGPFVLAAKNTFSGLTISSQATVRVTSDANLGPANSTLTLSGGTLSPIDPTLTINRPIAVPYSQSAVATNGGTVILNGAVTGSNALTKSGAGTLVLTNLNNTVSFSVIGGTLQVDNVADGKIGNGGQVTVNYGGNLAGTGFVGYTSVGNGSISPGDSGPGTLRVGSGLYLLDGVTLNFDLGTAASDQLVLSGGHYFEIQSGKKVTVNLADAGGLAAGQTYKIMDWNGASTYGVTAASFQLGSSPVNAAFTITADGALMVTTSAYTPLQAWQYKYFGSINNTAAAPDANPSSDGISNLLKYSLGLNPLRPTTAGLPQAGVLPGYLTLTYTKPKSVTDIVYTPQFSDDLAIWSNAGIIVETLSDDGTTQTMRARVASNGTGRRFLRMQVSAQ